MSNLKNDLKFYFIGLVFALFLLVVDIIINGIFEFIGIIIMYSIIFWFVIFIENFMEKRKNAKAISK